MSLIKKIAQVSCIACVAGMTAVAAQAETACETELSPFVAAYDAPADGVNAEDLEQASIMLNMLLDGCETGADAADLDMMKDQVKAMLKMEDPS